MVRPCRKPGVHVDLFDGEMPAPRPAWRVIEAARNKRLTGELVLASNPPTHVYLINGEVYFAERATDGGIAVRLLVEGVITRKQMSKGAVMVSGAEHLGRLFERDETIDRHAVELCVELMTDEVLTTVAEEIVDGYTMTLYKRHPSGIDRWLPNPTPDHELPPINEEQRAAALAAPVAPPPVAPPAAPTVPTLAPAPAVVPVVAPAPAPTPTLAPAPSRTPERLDISGWPSAPAEPTTLPTRTEEPPPKPAPAPTAIADEVADAVRRALAAIDSVLTPADDVGTTPPPQQG